MLPLVGRNYKCLLAMRLTFRRDYSLRSRMTLFGGFLIRAGKPVSQKFDCGRGWRILLTNEPQATLPPSRGHTSVDVISTG